MRKTTLSRLCGFALLALTGATPVAAQQVTTAVGQGSDFWTGSMAPELFQLHENGGAQACSGTEVFITVRATLGFCIDANEQASGAAVEWDFARESCAAAGKRLPEPAEYTLACSAGVNQMTGNSEWASNFAWLHSGSSTLGYATVGAGSTSCRQRSHLWIYNHTNSTVGTARYRCVH